MHSIHISSFSNAMSVIRNANSVFVIPTFQRPYAWDDAQIGELLNDLKVMYTRKPPMHYLAAVHVAPLRRKEDLIRYTDAENPDLQSLLANDFRDDVRNPLDICFVIDGQQRLTTLFALYAGLYPGFSKQLTITVQGREIPRLLLNPVADQKFFRAIMTDPQVKPQGQSQKRIAHLFYLASQITTTQREALEDQNLKLLLVEVDADYGLKSFLSLNDRGKPLSVLDRLKCLWMEKDENATSTDLAALHHGFGNAFHLLDHTAWGKEPFPEERFVRLLGIRAYWASDTNCVWHDSQQLFDGYFKPKVNVAAAESKGL